MWNFLKNLFHLSPTYSLGALESPADVRDISIADVQTPVKIPESYMTDISMLPVEDQMQIGSCVAQSHMKLVQYFFYKQTGKVIDLSARAIYRWAKDVDGIPEVQGTFPSIMAKIITKKGTPLATYAPNVNSLAYKDYLSVSLGPDSLRDASGRILAGYAFVPLNFSAVKQAIFQNGCVTGITDVDSNWFIGIIRKVLNIIGRHSTLFYGYDTEGIYARNSWSSSWIGKLLGNLPFTVGDFYFKWADYQDNIYDIIAYLKIPEALLQEAEGKDFQFLNNLRIGNSGYEVYKLQERLKAKGFYIGKSVDGVFGNGTKQGVINYQSINGLTPDGVVGQKTREKLNMKPDYLSIWMGAITQMEGALPRRNNPGNLKFRGQQYAVNDGGFCRFDTLAHGQQALRNLLINACTGKSSAYNPEMNLVDFYKVYAPSYDNNDPAHYAQFVADKLGLPVETKIKNLI